MIWIYRKMGLILMKQFNKKEQVSVIDQKCGSRMKGHMPHSDIANVTATQHKNLRLPHDFEGNSARGCV